LYRFVAADDEFVQVPALHPLLGRKVTSDVALLPRFINGAPGPAPERRDRGDSGTRRREVVPEPAGGRRHDREDYGDLFRGEVLPPAADASRVVGARVTP
jgi:hypothetical protein